jgi:putative FmdB family regulatory protein
METRACFLTWDKSEGGKAMPTYIYRCESCNETFEQIESIAEHETAKSSCPNCNSKKVIQVPAPFMAITGKKS